MARLVEHAEVLAQTKAVGDLVGKSSVADEVTIAGVGTVGEDREGGSPRRTSGLLQHFLKKLQCPVGSKDERNRFVLLLYFGGTKLELFNTEGGFLTPCLQQVVIVSTHETLELRIERFLGKTN